MTGDNLDEKKNQIAKANQDKDIMLMSQMHKNTAQNQESLDEMLSKLNDSEKDMGHNDDLWRKIEQNMK